MHHREACATALTRSGEARGGLWAAQDDMLVLKLTLTSTVTKESSEVRAFLCCCPRRHPSASQLMVDGREEGRRWTLSALKTKGSEAPHLQMCPWKHNSKGTSGRACKL